MGSVSKFGQKTAQKAIFLFWGKNCTKFWAKYLNNYMTHPNTCNSISLAIFYSLFNKRSWKTGKHFMGHLGQKGQLLRFRFRLYFLQRKGWAVSSVQFNCIQTDTDIFKFCISLGKVETIFTSKVIASMKKVGLPLHDASQLQRQMNWVVEVN